MQRPRSFGVLFGAALASIVPGLSAVAQASGAAAHPRRPGLCTSRFLSDDDGSLPKPPRPHPIDNSSSETEPRTPRSSPPVTAPRSSKPAPPESGDAAPPPVRRRPSRRVPPSAAPPPLTDAPAPGGLSHDRIEIKRAALQFRALLEQRRVRMMNDERDRAQVDALCLDGLFAWPAPPNSGRAAPRTPESDPSASGFDQDPLSASSRTAGRVVPADEITVGQAPPDFGPGPLQKPKSVAPAPAPVSEPPPELFKMLNALAMRSTPDRPLTITSLLRPPYRTSRYPGQSAVNPHALGIAVDITGFAGHAILTDNPEEEVQACLALIRSLPPGRYRMGLPKAPVASPAPRLESPDPAAADADPAFASDGEVQSTRRGAGPLPSRGGGRIVRTRRGDSVQSDPAAAMGQDPLSVARAQSSWPFFPPPQKGLDAEGKQAVLFVNERYADEQYLGDDRLKQAFAEARRRGVDFIALFPDGVNHIHVDVKQSR